MALFNDHYLAADGIGNAIEVLDEIETGSYSRLDFVELNACPGGCVGGVAAVENPYIARVRLQSIRRYLPISQNRLPKEESGDDHVPEAYLNDEELSHAAGMKLDENRRVAMMKMQEIERLYQMLPEIDCGSCGAPTCRAFAEDVAACECELDECVIRMRERFHALLAEQEDRKNDG